MKMKKFQNFCNENSNNWIPRKTENSLTRDGSLISIPYVIFNIDGWYYGDTEINWSRLDYRMYKEYGRDYGKKDFIVINNFTGEKSKGICTDSKNGEKLEIENWEEFKTNAQIAYRKWDEFLGLKAYDTRWTDTNYQVLNNAKDDTTKDKIFQKGIDYIKK